MRLYFKQRFFSWFDSYDIYDEATGEPVFTVEGKLAWGHCLHILDAQGRHIATVKERILTFLPKFELYLGVRARFQRLAGAGQLYGVGLYDRGRPRRTGRLDLQGTAALDGYVYDRRAGPAERPVCADGRACH